MPFQDVFTGGITGGLQGLQAGMNIGGMLQQKNLAQQQASRQKQIMELGLMEREGQLLKAVGDVLDLPPAQRKTQLTLLDEQLKKIQQFRGQEPIGLGPAIFEVAAKADDEMVQLVKPLIDKYGSEYLKGNPQAVLAFKDPVKMLGALGEEMRKAKAAEEQSELIGTLKTSLGGGTLGGAFAGQAGQGTAGQGTVGEQPASGSSGGSMASQPPFAISQAPQAAPAARPSPYGMPSINVGKEGTTLNFAPRKYGPAQFENKRLPNGLTQRVRQLTDPESGQVIEETPFGDAFPPEQFEAVYRGALAAGYQQGTPEFDAFVNLAAMAPSEVRMELLRKAQAQRPAGGGGVPSVGAAMDAVEKRASDRRVDEAARIKAATEAGDPLGGEQQGIVGPQTTAINTLQGIVQTFTPKEIDAYAGAGNKLREDVKAGASGIGQAIGVTSGKIDERYQEFRAALAEVRLTIQNAMSGKTVTPYEGQSLLAMLPTGEEAGGPQAFRAKFARAMRMLQISRETRVELARMGKGKIDLDALDARLREKYGALKTGGGESIGGGAKDPLGIR